MVSYKSKYVKYIHTKKRKESNITLKAVIKSQEKGVKKKRTKRTAKHLQELTKWQ